jgi:hypothetical protein
MELMTKLEHQAMEIEYILDSTLHHCLRKKCDCIKPIAFKRLNKARNTIRGLRERIRNSVGSRQRTMTDPGFNKLWGRGLMTIWDCEPKHIGYTKLSDLCYVRDL